MIHTRQQLLSWLGKNIDDVVLQLVLESGDVEVLGGFRPLPTSHNGGWLVVMTYRGNTHLVAVAEDRKHLGRFYWFRAPYVPWQYWQGNETNNPLFQGDRPDEYRKMRAGDGRFSRIVGCASLCTEADRGNSGSESCARMGHKRGIENAPPAAPKPETVRHEKASR